MHTYVQKAGTFGARQIRDETFSRIRLYLKTVKIERLKSETNLSFYFRNMTTLKFSQIKNIAVKFRQSTLITKL